MEKVGFFLNILVIYRMWFQKFKKIPKNQTHKTTLTPNQLSLNFSRG